jgi:hypothetical protein
MSEATACDAPEKPLMTLFRAIREKGEVNAADSSPATQTQPQNQTFSTRTNEVGIVKRPEPQN